MNELEIYNQKIIDANNKFNELKKEIDFLEKRKYYLIGKELGFEPENEKKDKIDKLKISYLQPQNTLSFRNKSEQKKVKRNNKEKIINYLRKEDLDEIIFNEKLIQSIGTGRQLLEKFVDRVAERSLFLYRNNNCHTCTKEVKKGNHTSKCPKCHEIFGYN